ncbi:MAG: hypothetical protein DI570_14105 [Phenylobacterium zucineum]|nr:MAG: hypothetical protein DI570_14105 [Phenylobacterium zucineum]
MPPPPDRTDLSKAAVLGRLQAETPPGKTVSANLFLDVPEDEMEAAASRLLECAIADSPEDAAPTLGKVHKLARSISLRATPDVLAKLAGTDIVREILPSEVDDILPQPLDVKRLDPS